MKRFIFTLLLLSSFALATQAQKSGFGIKAGVTNNNMMIKTGGEKVDGQKTGISFGLLQHFQLDKHIALQPNLVAALRGADIHGIKFTIWSIDVPVNLLYTHKGFFIGGGPNFSYMLDGRAKGDNLTPDGEVDIHSEEGGVLRCKRVELGVNALMGYTFPGGLSLSANFTHGLNDLSKNYGDFDIHTKQIGFSVAYIFGKKK